MTFTKRTYDAILPPETPPECPHHGRGGIDRRRRNVIDGPTGPWVDHVTEPPVADPPAATRSPAGGKRTVLEPNPQERRLVIVGAQRILDAYDDGPTASTPKVDDSRRRRQDSALPRSPVASERSSTRVGRAQRSDWAPHLVARARVPSPAETSRTGPPSLRGHRTSHAQCVSLTDEISTPPELRPRCRERAGACRRIRSSTEGDRQKMR